MILTLNVDALAAYPVCSAALALWTRSTAGLNSIFDRIRC